MTSGLQSKTTWLIVVGSVLVAGGRFTVPGHAVSWPGSYEAMAHIWVGVLLCLGFTGDHKKQAWIALGLTSVLELAMAIRR